MSIRLNTVLVRSTAKCVGEFRVWGYKFYGNAGVSSYILEYARLRMSLKDGGATRGPPIVQGHTLAADTVT